MLYEKALKCLNLKNMHPNLAKKQFNVLPFSFKKSNEFSLIMMYKDKI